LEEAALYGAQVHAVVPDAESGKIAIQQLLTNRSIHVHSIEWITPTLEDVFISSITSNQK
jgi:hypothetical protein